MNSIILSDDKPMKGSGDTVFSAALHKRGHEATIVNADLGFRYPEALGGDVLAVLPVRAAWNDDLKGFLRVARAQTVVWDPGQSNCPIVKEILCRGTVDYVHLCATKASDLTGKTGAAAASELAAMAHPATMVLVTDNSGAWAARHGQRVIHAPADHVEPAYDYDGCGCGPAWLAGFVASLCASPRPEVRQALMDGHLTAAHFIRCRQETSALPTAELLEALRESYELAHPRPVSLPRRLIRAAAAVFALW